MKILRGALLTGAALLLLTGIAYAGEREQTRQLNLQSQAATAQQPIAIALDAAAKTSDATPSFAPMALNSLTNPPEKIATAPVVDVRGTPVGAVRKVEMDANGKPLQVQIALLGSDRIVALKADALSYDLSNNVVTAALDKNQMAALPPVPPRG